MRIGYSADDATHRALIVGLHRRWCPSAELVQGHFRGELRLRRRTEVPKICEELALKGADVIVFLADGDGRPWRDVWREERDRVPGTRWAMTVVGISDRNVECWICADPEYISNQSGVQASRFRVDDPKGEFEAAMGISSLDRKEAEIAELVRHAPLQHWLISNDSFRTFYENLRAMSQQRGCQIENLLEKIGP